MTVPANEARDRLAPTVWRRGSWFVPVADSCMRPPSGTSLMSAFCTRPPFLAIDILR
jgi:hypothetical protein